MSPTPTVEFAQAWRLAGGAAEALITHAPEEGVYARVALQLMMYVLVRGLDDAAVIPATTAPTALPRTARALHGWLRELGHQLAAEGDDDPVAGAWQLLTAEQDRLGQALDDAARITRRAAEQNA